MIYYLFFTTIISCALMTLVVPLLMDYDYLSVGASGFGYGIFGVYVAITFFRKTLIDKDSRYALLLFIGIGWFLSSYLEGVEIPGHLGGFISGVIVGVVFLRMNGIKRDEITNN